MLTMCSHHLECSIVGARRCLMVRRRTKERSAVVCVASLPSIAKNTSISKEISSSTRRSNSPTNFDPASVIFTPKRPRSTLLEAKHSATVSTDKLPSVTISRAAVASSSRPSSLQHPQVLVLPSNRLHTSPKPNKQFQRCTACKENPVL